MLCSNLASISSSWRGREERGERRGGGGWRLGAVSGSSSHLLLDVAQPVLQTGARVEHLLEDDDEVVIGVLAHLAQLAERAHRPAEARVGEERLGAHQRRGGRHPEERLLALQPLEVGRPRRLDVRLRTVGRRASENCAENCAPRELRAENCAPSE